MTDLPQHGQEGPTATKPTYLLVQVLRGLAALMVVVHHATIMLSERCHFPLGNWVEGSTGVDIFFVISGFVMTISSAPLRRAPNAARTFLARRLERVVPLYWIVTAAKVAVLLLWPAISQRDELGSVQHVLFSFLFLPSFGPQRHLDPVVVVGWTLNFEMFFYALFALTLALRRSPWTLLPALFVLPLLGWGKGGPYAALFYRQTLLWEFALGILLGLAIRHVRRVPWPLGLAFLLLGMQGLLFGVKEADLSPLRGALWGLPAAAVVLGVLSLERRWGAKSPRWALEIGDASYSIYLVHTLVLPAIGLWLVRWPRKEGVYLWAALAICVMVSTLAGETVYSALERPVTRWFKGRRKTAVPANG